MKKSELDGDFIKKYILKSSNLTNPLISIYRKPWRWDIKVDKEIRNLLLEKSEFSQGRFNALDYYKLPIIEKWKPNSYNEKYKKEMII